MNKDAKLAAFFARDEGPEHDPAFSLGVAEAIARRAFWMAMLRRGALAIAIGTVAWALAPLAGGVGAALGSPLVLTAALVAGAGALAPRILTAIPAFRPTRA